MKFVMTFVLMTAAVWLSGCPGASETNSNTNSTRPTPSPSNTNSTNANGQKTNLEMPEFPFPPNASAEYEIEMAWLRNPNGGTTFDDVSKKLKAALRANGYQNLGYYAVPSDNGGFVITSSLEQFTADGKLLAGANRFTRETAAPSIFSIYYWANAIRGNVGRYRLIAFMVTDKLYEVNRSEPNLETAENLASGGFNDLTPQARQIPLTDRHTCTALIYEFSKDRKDGKVIFVKKSDVSAEAHLQNLLKTLKGGG